MRRIITAIFLIALICFSCYNLISTDFNSTRVLYDCELKGIRNQKSMYVPHILEVQRYKNTLELFTMSSYSQQYMSFTLSEDETNSFRASLHGITINTQVKPSESNESIDIVVEFNYSNSSSYSYNTCTIKEI